MAVTYTLLTTLPGSIKRIDGGIPVFNTSTGTFTTRLISEVPQILNIEIQAEENSHIKIITHHLNIKPLAQYGNIYYQTVLQPSDTLVYGGVTRRTADGSRSRVSLLCTDEETGAYKWDIYFRTPDTTADLVNINYLSLAEFNGLLYVYTIWDRVSTSAPAINITVYGINNYKAWQRNAGITRRDLQIMCTVVNPKTGSIKDFFMVGEHNGVVGRNYLSTTFGGRIISNGFLPQNQNTLAPFIFSSAKTNSGPNIGAGAGTFGFRDIRGFQPAGTGPGGAAGLPEAKLNLVESFLLKADGTHLVKQLPNKTGQSFQINANATSEIYHPIQWNGFYNSKQRSETYNHYFMGSLSSINSSKTETLNINDVGDSTSTITYHGQKNLITKCDLNNNIIWTVQLRQTVDAFETPNGSPTSIVPTPDGGCVVFSGGTFLQSSSNFTLIEANANTVDISTPSPRARTLIYKLSSDGTLEWYKTSNTTNTISNSQIHFILSSVFIYNNTIYSYEYVTHRGDPAFETITIDHNDPSFATSYSFATNPAPNNANSYLNGAILCRRSLTTGNLLEAPTRIRSSAYSAVTTNPHVFFGTMAIRENQLKLYVHSWTSISIDPGSITVPLGTSNGKQLSFSLTDMSYLGAIDRPSWHQVSPRLILGNQGAPKIT